MAQAKKKQVTKTAKKTTRKTTSCAKSKSCAKKCDNRERNHIFIVTAMSMIIAILLCASAAMMMA